VDRYKDIYTIARRIISHGHFLKLCAIGIPLLFIIGALFSGSGGTTLVLAVIIGMGIGIFMYSYAVSVSAQGQLLLAVADIAVNTSPLLDKRQKAKIIDFDTQQEEESEDEDVSEEEKDDKEVPQEELKYFCFHCGEELSEKVSRCPKCGKEL
jgi:hypothetical protein